MSEMERLERQIVVTVKEHRDTHLLVAVSDDLKGLMVAARSREQLERELPIAIREMLEAEGNRVFSVTTADPPDDVGHFLSRTVIASAQLEASRRGGGGLQ